jgi:multicomponent Na+:H+ antiporter subunit E
MDSRKRWRLIRIAQTFTVLLAVWFMFSWSLEPSAVIAGIILTALIAAVSFDVFIEEHEAARHSVIPRIFPVIVFFFTLVITMYASSFRMLASILSGTPQPRVVHFRSKLRSDLARVVLAEAITFTPGTITMELDDDHMIVHWLNATTHHSAKAGDEIKGELESSIRRAWM